MLIGGVVGFVFGFLVGMLVNPPFSGMTETSSDVQGLTYLTWFGLGVVGGGIGAIVAGFDFESSEERRIKEEPTIRRNKRLHRIANKSGSR